MNRILELLLENVETHYRLSLRTWSWSLLRDKPIR